MKKIKTLFVRDFNNQGKITKEYAVEIAPNMFASEKLDGTNVRLTVRSHKVVRLEKRRNPTKIQKHEGIEAPWYVDAGEGPEDKWIWEAVRGTNLKLIEDGEWSGEAVGPKIQGNPLNLEKHIVFLFSVREVLHSVSVEPPITYKELESWLFEQKSKFGNDCGIEGIVWWDNTGPIAKIKSKDFK